MNKFIKIFIILLFAAFLVFVDNTGEKEKVTFNACVDGDTAWLNVNGVKTKFRFLAIDTPETVHPTKDIEAYGKNASEYTCNRLKNAKDIRVEYDSNSKKTDKYDRNLAWIWVDGSLLEQELIEIGYAKVAYVYGSYSYVENLCYVQSLARKQEKGLWSDTSLEEGYCSKVDYKNSGIIKKIDVSEENDSNLNISTEKVILFGVVVIVMLCDIDPKKIKRK